MVITTILSSLFCLAALQRKPDQLRTGAKGRVPAPKPKPRQHASQRRAEALAPTLASGFRLSFAGAPIPEALGAGPYFQFKCGSAVVVPHHRLSHGPLAADRWDLRGPTGPQLDCARRCSSPWGLCSALWHSASLLPQATAKITCQITWCCWDSAMGDVTPQHKCTNGAHHAGESTPTPSVASTRKLAKGPLKGECAATR